MESTPDDRDHGYDDQAEEQAYEQREGSGGSGGSGESGDEDAGPASQPDEGRPPADE